MIVSLVFKVIEYIQYTQSIGPLIKIFGKMSSDFFNFFILYAILVMMFALVGNLNFLLVQDKFTTLLESGLFVLDASIGNYDFLGFQEQITDSPWLLAFGNFYTITIVVCFNILILNLIIAILSNTYNIFDTRSKGLYLSKILNARDDHPIDDEMFHAHYGSMLLTMTPLNIVVLPFVPYALMFKPSKYINNLLLIS